MITAFIRPTARHTVFMKILKKKLDAKKVEKLTKDDYRRTYSMFGKEKAIFFWRT